LDHAPTLNNLGVILWQQNQVGGSLNFYNQAMAAAPMNILILNNVAEALNGLKGDQKEGIPAKRLLRQFSEQDGQMQAKLGAEGLYRWGGTWVNQAELDKLKAAEKQVKEKLDAMAQEFDAIKGKIQVIDDNISGNERGMRQIEASSWMHDSEGRWFQTVYPGVYYDLARDNERLKANKVAEQRKLEEMRVAAKTVQQQLPVPRYTGVQQMVGVEGTPVVMAESPTTQATTQATTAPSTQP
jgi:hypothetical protein